jgi:hypothetical protein
MVGIGLERLDGGVDDRHGDDPRELKGWGLAELVDRPDSEAIARSHPI